MHLQFVSRLGLELAVVHYLSGVHYFNYNPNIYAKSTLESAEAYYFYLRFRHLQYS